MGFAIKISPINRRRVERFTLTSADYLQIGRDLSGAGLPTVFTMEGGYAVAEVGVNVVNVLEGFANA